VALTPGGSSHLALVLERLPEAPHEPDFVSDAPLVAFEAFTIDERLYGWVRLEADRLTDLLNASEGLRLVNVLRERHFDGSTATGEQVVVARRDLIAVQASGPRGNERRRRPTRSHPLAVQSGPYLIGGYLHARQGMEPLADVQGREPMIPLTSAWIEYWAMGRRAGQWIGTIIFNRDLTDSVEVVSEDDLLFGQLLHRPLVGQ